MCGNILFATDMSTSHANNSLSKSTTAPLLLKPKLTSSSSSTRSSYSRSACWFVTAITVILVVASNAGLAYASVRKVDDLNQQMDARILVQQIQKKQQDPTRSPIDNLFSMHNAR